MARFHQPAVPAPQLFAWRGILGFGVGGEYPLAATLTSEASSMLSRGVAVLSIFSMQGWGKLTAAGELPSD